MIIHSPIISGSLTFADGATFTLPDNGIYSGSFSGSAQFSEVSSHIIPDTANTYDLGSPTKWFRDLYISSGSAKFLKGNGQVAFALKADASGNKMKIVNDNDEAADIEVKSFTLKDPTGGGNNIKWEIDNGALGKKKVNDDGEEDTSEEPPTLSSNISGSLTVTGSTALQNTVINGTLDVTGLSSLDGGIDVDGAFTVADGSGNVSTTGTLDVTGATGIDGNFDIATDKFTVSAASGNTAIAGTLGVTGNTSLTGTLGVTGDTTLQATDIQGTFQIGGTPLTSTASELNLLDGSTAGTVVSGKAVVYGNSGEIDATTLLIDGTPITSTAEELNKLDGVTSSTAELNILTGVTADATEINKLDGLTSSTAELNILTGVTADASEINKLDGLTSSTSELNILTGVTVDATKLNYLSDMTGNVKNYIDTEVAGIVDTAPEALNTLNELAAALGDDPNFATTISAQIGGKVSQSLQVIAGDGLTGGGDLTQDRTLNVVGTANRISVTADAIDIASTYVGQTSITTLGTIGTGVWEGTDVAIAHGGTGASTAAGALTNLGLTATAAEINKLDGVTTTTAELNFVSGVTSAIQDQLDAITGTDIGVTLTGAVTGTGTITNLGNVSIATTATADPTLTINGDASGTATFTNLGNATLTLTIADDSHNHTIANVDGLQAALDAKQAGLSAGTGVSISSNTVSIGQAVATNSNVTFATVSATGDIVAYASSDERLKDNIEVISNPIEKVQQLKGVTWDWNDNADELQKSLPNVGVIAQDVEKVLPQLVKDRDNGFKGVDYDKIVGLLIEAIKDQQTQIDELKSKLS